MNTNLQAMRLLTPFFVCIFAVAACQTPTPSRPALGMLTGHVRDENGVPIQDAAVSVTNLEPRAHADVAYGTDASGSYRASLLTPGRYLLTVQLTGWVTQSREVVVTEHTQTTANFVLRRRP